MLTDATAPGTSITPESSHSVLSNPVVRFLQAHIGLEPESLGVRVLGHCLSDLAREFPGLSDTAIVRSARSDGAVFARVVAHFSINESWLFRNPGQFAELRLFVQARLNTERTLKVLSLPCACGEEPASIAITLHEAGLPASAFSIVAGDLDSEALAQARQGTFGLSAFRGTVPDPRWFEKRDHHYVLLPSLLARIEFRQLNVLDPELFQGELFDVIFCRNLLIYLHGEARVQVLQLLRRVAAPGALVFTGTAEPTLRFDAPAILDAPHRFNNANRGGVLAPLTGSKIAAASPNKIDAVAKITSPSLATTFVVLPATKVPESGPEVSSASKNRLALVELCANEGDLVGACSMLEQLLEEAPTYAEAWYLSGVLASAQNDLARAEIALDRAAYLDPSHAATLRLRAELARRGGDIAHADRIRARLKRREDER